MGWTKVDDRLAFHRKTIKAGNAAMGLWVRALSFAGGDQRDGFVEYEVALSMGTQQEADTLCRVGLWVEEMDGYRFHGWDEYQLTTEQWDKKKADAAERTRAWRERKAATKSVTRHERITRRVGDGPVTALKEPEPEKDISTPAKAGAAKNRGTRIPDDFAMTDKLAEYAKAKAPAVNADLEIEKFKNHWGAASGAKAVKLEWSKAFMNWLLNAQSYAENAGWKAPAASAQADQLSAERAARLEQRRQWCEARGVTLAEYQQNRETPGWLDSLSVKGTK
jgi:hypothetical protein